MKITHVGQASACHAPARPGFTLVELLAVVSIIALLVGMLTPALMGARRSAINARVKSEIDMLHTALMNYKNEYGSFPPANMGPAPNAGALWISDNAGVNTRHPVYRHLVRIFPRISELQAGPNSPYKRLAAMSPAQALVFWLRGFYENPEYPLTNDNRAGPRKKFFDFDETRLYAASEYAVGATQVFQSRNAVAMGSFEREFPVYFTSQPSCGLPYVYFDSRCYDLFGNDLTYRATDTNANLVSMAVPYMSSELPAGFLWSQAHVNADTFQLIAAGIDGSYGEAQAAFPREIPNTIQFNNTPIPYASASVLLGHGDNITNFASKPLAETISALKAD
jgi:prepilin-type N-terminal cleavage/methylation domain-containing protein